MNKSIYTVKIAGPAGAGIKNAGKLLSTLLTRHGYSVFDYSEYPSLVRGGHNTYQVSFSSRKIYTAYSTVDIFISLKPGHWRPHLQEFHTQTLIFSDETPHLKKHRVLSLPFAKIIQELDSDIYTNTVSLGLLSFLLRLDIKITQSLLKKSFPQKIEANLKAFRLGYEYGQSRFAKYQLQLNHHIQNLAAASLYDGNEALGWGFLAGQGNFYAAYPMTPSTGLLHFLAEKQKQFNLVVRHPEDEIAAANMASGAAFAGSRAAVGTSGGGFALMTESVSFSAMAEIGMVYYLIQRPAPATGMPTWTSQSDLLFSVFSGHGDFLKIVLAPGTHLESFDFSWQALNLADILQTPIIVLTDKFLAESSTNLNDLSKIRVSIDRGKIITSKISTGFKRYSLKSTSGISSRSLPGIKDGMFLANSYEHDETGFATEDGKTAALMAGKRLKKIKTAFTLTPLPILHGPKNFTTLILSWGSTTAPILETLQFLKQKHTSFLQIRTLWPLHPKIKTYLSKAKKIIVIENNQTSQLTTLLKSQFFFQPNHTILKFDGRPFFPEELYEKIKKL